jgi:hypothetical protein
MAPPRRARPGSVGAPLRAPRARARRLRRVPHAPDRVRERDALEDWPQLAVRFMQMQAFGAPKMQLAPSVSFTDPLLY